MSSAKRNGRKRAVYIVIDSLYFGAADAIVVYLIVYILAAGSSYLMLKSLGGWPAIIVVNLAVYTLNQIISRVFKNDDVGFMVALTYFVVTLFPLFHLFFK
ncbi:hypothetical protein ACLED0_00155 [Lonsdalea quercina]|uniref:hypothetical protein n=1 Tax=Lonsdalea quercina TaxID=71657 RepID=UPI0039761DE7